LPAEAKQGSVNGVLLILRQRLDYFAHIGRQLGLKLHRFAANGVKEAKDRRVKRLSTQPHYRRLSFTVQRTSF
jgi:hypothetical protein